jgi:hypothetical protein
MARGDAERESALSAALPFWHSRVARLDGLRVKNRTALITRAKTFSNYFGNPPPVFGGVGCYTARHEYLMRTRYIFT